MNGKRGSTLGSVQNTSQRREITIAPMQSSQLLKLFVDELRDNYWVARALINVIPKMIKNATSPALTEALTNHLTDTEFQSIRIERIFESLGKKPSTKRSLAMEGLLKEVGELMGSCDPGAMCDAGIISAAQKIQHYEIASFETLRQFAEALGLEEAVVMFEAAVDEQKSSIEIFTGVSVSAIQLHDYIEEGDDDELVFSKAFNLQFT